MYTLLLSELGIHFSADRSEWHAPFVWTEVLFFMWSAGRILSEAKEFGTEDDGTFGERVRGYLRDPWNQLDLSFNIAVLGVLHLRIFLLHVDAPGASSTAAAAAAAAGGGEIDLGLASSEAERDHVVAVIGSNSYALMIVLCYFRGLQFMGYYRSIGVLTIVVKNMMSDVMIWVVLASVMSLGFAFAFVTLLPQASMEHSWHLFMGLHPVYESLWLWVGAAEHATRGNIQAETGDELPTAVVMPTLTWVYQFIISVVLVNLLIAMMSDTYAKVMEQGRERWTFERAQLIAEFKDTKAPFPPPFNLLWQLLVELPAELRKKDEAMECDGFKVVPDQKMLTKLETSEGVYLKRCLSVQQTRVQQGQAWQFTQLRDLMERRFETLARQLEASNGTSS